MNMDPGPILLEDLRVSDVASEKVTVVLIAQGIFPTQGANPGLLTAGRFFTV